VRRFSFTDLHGNEFGFADEPLWGALKHGCKPTQVRRADVLLLREVAAERDWMYTGAASHLRLASEAQLGKPFTEPLGVYGYFLSHFTKKSP